MALKDDALRLGELDQQVVRAVIQGDREELPGALATYMELRRDLKTRLLDESVASVSDPEAANILRKITTGDGLPTDALIERLSAKMEEGEQFEDFDDYDIEKLGSDLFYSWFSHHEYITGLAELRPLILQSNTSDAVSALVRQVKDCYAFQQYEAALALCRMMIEASVRDICVKKNLFPDLGKNVVLFEKYLWSELRDKVSSGPLREELAALYSRLCAVVHARKTVSREECRDTFEETLRAIERLYESHGL